MTLKDLLQGQGTEEQYRLLMAADVLLPCGRFYGGTLTPDQIAAMAKPERKR